VKTSAAHVRGRVVIVDRTGRVLADSEPGGVGADYSTRPEIAGALRGRIVQEERDSDTLGQRTLATAVPVVRGGRPNGAVRVTQSVDAMHRAVRASTIGLVLVGGIVLALGLAAGALLAASVTRPLRRLAAAARRAGEGDLAVRVPEEEGSREQRDLGRAFNEMTGRVQTMIDAQRDFVADASHQLRTPLTGLRLRLEEAAATASGPARAQVDGALVEVDRLAGVVTELLALSEAGLARAPDSATGLLDAARRAAERWSGHGATVVVRGEDGGPVRCVPDDVDRILDVLVENAIDYGPGGQRIALAVSPGRLQVADEGPGLAAGEEEAVFNRFRRGSAGRASRRGTGLGLAIARELAGRWDGAVTLENGPTGAVATVTLPLVGAVAAAAAGG
jgi:signal transduction histidine kinase